MVRWAPNSVRRPQRQSASACSGLISSIYTSHLQSLGDRWSQVSMRQQGQAQLAPLGLPNWQRGASESSHHPRQTGTVLGRPTFVTAGEGGPEGPPRGLEESSEGHQHSMWAHPEPALRLLAQLSHQPGMRGGEEVESGQEFCVQDASLCNRGGAG